MYCGSKFKTKNHFYNDPLDVIYSLPDFENLISPGIPPKDTGPPWGIKRPIVLVQWMLYFIAVQ